MPYRSAPVARWCWPHYADCRRAAQSQRDAGGRGTRAVVPRRVAWGTSRRGSRFTGFILRVMQAQAPPLLPLLRSRLQAELLTLVLLTPGREWTLTELTELAGRVGRRCRRRSGGGPRGADRGYRLPPPGEHPPGHRRGLAADGPADRADAALGRAAPGARGRTRGAG